MALNGKSRLRNVFFAVRLVGQTMMAIPGPFGSRLDLGFRLGLLDGFASVQERGTSSDIPLFPPR